VLAGWVASVEPDLCERTGAIKVRSGAKERYDHGEDPVGAAGHVHVGGPREHGKLAVWQQLGGLKGIGHADEVVVANQHQGGGLYRPQVVGLQPT
jgi:hypothetical protein